MISALLAVIRKDLKQYFADPKAVLISLAVPFAIASFMGLIFASTNSGAPPSKIEVLVSSAATPEETQTLMTTWAQSDQMKPVLTTAADAEARVRNGSAPVMISVPENFLGQSAAALGGGPQPTLKILGDPTKAMEVGMVQGAIIQGAMKATVSRKSGGAPPSADDSGLPFIVESTKATAAPHDANSSQTLAHSFAGMAIQGIMFGAIEMAMLLMRERQQGLLKRLLSVPQHPRIFLLGRILSGALRSFFVLSTVLLLGMAVFGFRVQGSWFGLILIGLASALCFSGFGLFVSALGRSEQQSRGLATLAVLMMAMLGGAWFPAFLFPSWAQLVTKVIPVRWAVDGIDAMTWRAATLTQAIVPALVLIAFAVIFSLIGMRRFRWEPEV